MYEMFLDAVETEMCQAQFKQMKELKCKNLFCKRWLLLSCENTHASYGNLQEQRLLK